MFLQLTDNVVKTSSCYQLTWVRRNRTSHKEIEFTVDTRRENLFLNVIPCIMVVYNQIGDTIMVVVNLEELCQTWLADIQTYHDNLLAQQGERDTYIGCHECFTFT